MRIRIYFFFLIFSSELTAGGVDIAAQGSADSSGDPAVLQGFLKPSHRISGAGLQGAFFHMVQRNQVEVGRQTLQAPISSLACSTVSLTPSIMAYSKDILRLVCS